MDASALLAKQGWRGHGHGLGSTGHGIARPLLVSNKQDALGVGKKKLQVADQWWMRAYDTGLKELGTGKQTALASIRQNGVNKGGLYGFFVRGEGLAGTLSDNNLPSEPLSSSTSSPSDTSTPATTPDAESTPEPKKRKRADGEEGKRKRTKEGSVAQSKGKDKKKDRRSKLDSAATEDPKLLRRAAKKALRQKRALRESGSKQAGSDGEDKAQKRGPATPAGETTASNTGEEKRSREGKGTDAPREAGKASSEKKLKKYAAKAAEKGMTVEAFLAKKERKKEKAKK
ncbi:dna-directed rna polymerase ii subunit rpb1 protein [Diplodia corticola]|uniref:Dna-directed rna polymerase ii subunit rpb1 protein n=1 Tax=Diplodia corticola TaxID=236234 RepID=A0A1J9S781_9PEZI|nr:dna-directed rna polymerase ii subunit rpb1 protein [Diplodia corticola]OJD35461.1 dna-directed rna polymerase ii subunit rpb1 protein [Diplodia corticola]